MKYLVEFNPECDPTQVEVEAETLLDAVEKAWGMAPIFPVEIDGELESSYRAEQGGQPWQRVVINVLPGGWQDDDLCDGEPCGTHRDPDDPDCCGVCGEAVLCEECGAPVNDFSGEVPCCSNPYCEVQP